MARGIRLTCVSDEDMDLQVEEDESDEGTRGLMFTTGDQDEGVLLPDGKVGALLEFLEDWRVRQASESN